MTSSLKRRSLSKPERGKAINKYDLGFVRGRNKNKAHSLLLELFQESGLSKAELAQMLGKRPEQITRWLAGPGNLTLDTLSELIFAVKGDFFEVRCVDELSRGKSNKGSAQCLAETMEAAKWEPMVINCGRRQASEVVKAGSGSNLSFTIKSSAEEQHYERYEAVSG